MKIAIAFVLTAMAAGARGEDLATRIDKLTAGREATVGIAAIDVITGRKFSYHADEAFPMGSVYKLPIVMRVLRGHDDGSLSLDKEVTVQPKDFSPGHSPLREEAKGQPITKVVGQLCVYALRDSDNTASDVLLGLVGGPFEVTKYIRFLGITEMSVNRSEKQIAADIQKNGAEAYWKDRRDTTTPSSVIVLLRAWDEKACGLSAGGLQFIRDLLEHSVNGETRIRAGLPADWTVRHKSGTMPGVVNDIAVADSPDTRHRLMIAVFTKGWKKTPDADREKLIADISAAVYHGLVE